MSTYEDQVRDALRSYGDAVPDAPELWHAIRREAAGRPARSRTFVRVGQLAAGLAAAAVVVAFVAVLGGQSGERVEVGSAQPEPEPGWRRIAEPPEALGSARDADVLWTGEELVVWTGGEGLAYDPDADRWRRLPEPPFGSRETSTAVWTGREMVVWGGHSVDDTGTNSGPLATGAAYDPRTDSWRDIASAPFGASMHAAVWTGHEMFVTGGEQQARALRSAAYDPARDRWRVLPDAPIGRRAAPVVAWLEGGVLVAGGVPLAEGEATDTAALYQLNTDAWQPLKSTGRDVGPQAVTAVMGTRLYVFDDSRVATLRTDGVGVAWGTSSDEPFGPVRFVAGASVGPEVLLVVEAPDGERRLVSYPEEGLIRNDLGSGPGGGDIGDVAVWTGEDLVVLGGEVSAAYRPERPGPGGACSAAALSAAVAPQEGLPRAVAETRAAVATAAVSCDYDRLSELAGGEFTASFGGGDPVRLWRDAERRGETPMRTLRALLDRPFGRDGDLYVWPREFGESDTYLAHRVGIRADGDWMFFVAGD